MMSIEEIRKRIDELDTSILESLAKRFSLLDDLTEYKLKNNLPIRLLDREQALIKEKIGKARNLGLNNDKFIADMFQSIIDESSRIQEEKRKQ
ncbi:MAG: chorismate mutase [archaeon]